MKRGYSRNKPKSIIKYVLLAVAIFLISLTAASFSSMLLRIIHFSEGQSGVIADMISGVIAAIAAGLVLYELKGNEQERIRQNNIEEASFILQYNQAFIQDPNMTEVENLLEKNAFYDLPSPIITDENRQKFVNYLVYLEGLAPLILNGILTFEHIDNLMAYRFFLAVNNSELQDKELVPFADYYCGCFKLYKKWKEYRLNNRLEIPLSEYSLDRIDIFRFIQIDRSPSKLISRQITPRDSFTETQYRDIATLIYQTDPYIYPALFSDCGESDPMKIAQKILPDIIESNADAMFNKRNLFVLFDEDIVIGIILWHSGTLQWDADRFIASADCLGFHLDEDKVSAVSQEYINEQYTEETNGTISLINICVSEYMQGVGIGEYLLRSFMAQHKRNDMELCVLSDNAAAVSLYKRFGFNIIDTMGGFSTDNKKPECYRMRRPGFSR